MSLILQIDRGSTLPAYEQVVQAVLRVIHDTTLLPGSRLPPIRQLAADLGVAPNTVAKAYRRLEELGHVTSRGRFGTFVGDTDVNPVHDEVRAAALLLARSCRRAGLGVEQGQALLRRAFR